MTHSTDHGSRRRWLARTAAATAAFGLAPLVRAQPAWPNKPVRIIVPFAPGGTTDVLARKVAEKVSVRLGQTLVIDNRGGAGGILGTDAVAKAEPDGYTWVVSLTTSLLVNQFLYDKLQYKPLRDLTMVSQLASTSLTLAVHPDVPAKNVRELMAYIRANKGKLSYGSWGAGSQAHLLGAYMSKETDGDLVHVPYKGEAPMLNDLAGGQIQFAFVAAMGGKPLADAGKLRLIAATGDQRIAVLPELGTFGEQGYKEEGFRLSGFVGMAAPIKTPVEIVNRMSREVAAACAMPDVRATIEGMGFRPVGGTPEAFAALYRKDLPAWESLVKLSGAKLD